MYTFLKVLWALISASLIFLVLLHSPKGDGLGGIGGQAQLFSSTKSAEITLNRVTWVLTVLFIGLTVSLSAGWIPQPSLAKPAAVTAPKAPTKSVTPVTPSPTTTIPPTLPAPN